MTRTSRLLAGFFAVALVVGCAAKRLPPGTPPPEYETRELPAWTGDAPDAGAPAPLPVEAAPVVDQPANAPVPTEQPKTEALPLDAGPGPSPDAGVR
jgi:hypothetical protein